ncbi:AzlC family ABC transporter permease [Oricola sp.]|uniref:AzlC family ABC transporter permease n=1 Tax=Oricola sp. TaxID=1979950 RepID=UPI0025E9B8C0|nr:AzlC family ABC transporter permease [Oricola sp.]MCI5074234.1 AzlC family ABC transporter permease [Oricola sp.]
MNARRDIIEGIRAATPGMLAATPFGLLFGALAVDNGFTVGEAVLMSATVFAGASQMVGIDLFGDRVAPWLIVLSIFAVNFRHVLYSAAMSRHMRGWSTLQRYLGFFVLIDPHYAETEKRAETGRPITFVWFITGGVAFYIMWVVEGWLGAVFGRLVENPAAYGVDFLLPIYFLGLVMGFRKRANWLPVVIASAAASIAAYALVGSPWHVSLGALAGIVVAAVIGAPAAPAEEG